MITGLDLLFLEVNNLEESVAFYAEVLGFEIESNNADAEPPIASLRSGSLRITLVQQIETMLKRGRGVHFPPAYVRRLGPARGGEQPK